MNEKTNWQGLWKRRSALYSGSVIKKTDIPKYARLIVRYNKFYEKDGSRPQFVYCFASGDAAEAIETLPDRSEYVRASDLRCFTDEQLQSLINRVACAVGGDGEYGEWLVEDFVDGYGNETEVF